MDPERQPLHDPLEANESSSYQSQHMKTYTAGEDTSRLAAAAKELGLARHLARRPRKQVRAATVSDRNLLWHLLTDTRTEYARMQAVLTNDDDDIPSADPHHEVGGDLVSAVLGIVKGMVGPAILYLPHGLAGAGYLTALPILFVATTMFLYSSHCLLASWKLERTKESSASLLSRPTRRVWLSYPELAYRALGHTGETLVKIGIALMQSGVCLTYLIFVPQNLTTSCLLLTGMTVQPLVWLAAMIGVQMPLSWIRDIRKLTLTNLLANLLILYGLLTCLGFAMTRATTPVADESRLEALADHIRALKPFNDEWFLFIGTSVLLFEGSITLLVPLQEAVQRPEQREAFPLVYRRTILSIIGFYLFFGLTNWMAYGATVRTVLTTSLPSGVLATSVQLAYSLAVVFTFPLQNFPALEITCRTVQQTMGKRSALSRRNVISGFIVLLLAVVAAATMESLDKVVSLMGSLLGCPIAFVFPPLIHLKLAGDALSPAARWGNRIVMGLGVVAMILASVTTLLTWSK